MSNLSKISTDLIIIGAGPAGYTAAIYAARANLNVILISGPKPGGQLLNTNAIENWPGQHQNISGIHLMNQMLIHVQKFPIKIIDDTIINVNFTNNPFMMCGEKNKYYSSAIIIATGASPRYLNIPSEKLYKDRGGISTCAICDGFFYKNKFIAVIGGGNTALEEALFLSNIAEKVYIVHRKKIFTADKILITRVMEKVKINKIILYMSYTVGEILGNHTGVTGIKICSDNNEILINLSGIFIAIGHIPNSNIFLNQLKTKNNYIEINIHKNDHKYQTQTSIPGIFAAGDVTDHVYRQAITASSGGCMAAMDAEKYIRDLI
ncbi:thioredoxin reductase [Buchnera aphidicola (Cinara tujafilina)]|uniref:Thioredoxin reductase n=1 Tax=Buchnera aphidicola (Cinara tujafilina) TaxID=261317 RepID=F7WZC7_9GAMM|nr:thioredoxin-disulfide reductase [Buchnera aphidicola]AEH39789.1 thioredoxin reductase [Buchnera aphidicola (Cinara tujafilina)]